MYWNFGNNFEQVTSTCSFNWWGCPIALIYYIWFELVTDVVDCLANETILWRVLGVFLIFTLLVHLIYWQVRWMTVIKRNKENLKRVDIKIQDLDLKMDILTYKEQYGTWPLPSYAKKKIKFCHHRPQCIFSKDKERNCWNKQLKIRKRIFKNELHNNLSLSSTSDSNDFYRENLTRNKTICFKDETHLCKPHNKENFSRRNLQEINCSGDECREFLSNRGHLQQIFENSDRQKFTEKNKQSNRISSMFTENTKKNFNTNMCCNNIACESTAESEIEYSSSTSTIMPLKNIEKIVEQNFSSCTSNSETTEKPHNTLSKVKKKLEKIYSVLKYYSSDDLRINTHQNLKLVRNKSEENFYKCRHKNHVADNNFSSNGIQEFSNSHLPTKFYKYKNEEYSNYDETTETSQDEKDFVRNNYHQDSENLLHDYLIQANNNLIATPNKLSRTELETFMPKTDLIPESRISLLQEALELEKKLLLEIDPEIKQLETRENSKNNMESNNHTNLEHIQPHFQRKILDMIKEESSGSISDKNKDQLSKSLNKYDFSDEEAIVENEFEKKSHSVDSDSENEGYSEKFVNEKISIKPKNELINDPSKNDDVKQLINLNTMNKYVKNSTISSNEQLRSKIETFNLKKNKNFNKLTESASDSSFDKLLDRLIESEKNSKSLKNSPDTYSSEIDVTNSLRNLINSKKHKESNGDSVELEKNKGILEHVKINPNYVSGDSLILESVESEKPSIKKNIKIDDSIDENIPNSKFKEESLTKSQNKSEDETPLILVKSLHGKILKNQRSSESDKKLNSKNDGVSKNKKSVHFFKPDEIMLKSKSSEEISVYIDSKEDLNELVGKEAKNIHSDDEIFLSQLSQKTKESLSEEVKKSDDCNITAKTDNLCESSKKFKNVSHSSTKAKIGSSVLQNREKNTPKNSKHTNDNSLQKPASRQIKSKSCISLNSCEKCPLTTPKSKVSVKLRDICANSANSQIEDKNAPKIPEKGTNINPKKRSLLIKSKLSKKFNALESDSANQITSQSCNNLSGNFLISEKEGEYISRSNSCGSVSFDNESYENSGLQRKSSKQSLSSRLPKLNKTMKNKKPSEEKSPSINSNQLLKMQSDNSPQADNYGVVEPEADKVIEKNLSSSSIFKDGVEIQNSRSEDLLSSKKRGSISISEISDVTDESSYTFSLTTTENASTISLSKMSPKEPEISDNSTSINSPDF